MLARAKNPDRYAAYDKKRHAENKNKKRASENGKRKLQRIDVIYHYGGRCKCCGEDRYEFLAIDHVNGGGRRHRKEIKKQLPQWLIENNYPEGFRILCHNCNIALGIYGYCPHENVSLETIGAKEAT